MKKFTIKGLGLAVAMFGFALSSCSDFEPEGMPQVPDLQTVENLHADIDGFDVVLSWTLPAQGNVSGVSVLTNGKSPVTLEGAPTSYVAVGQPMSEEYFYTVKVLYDGGYVREGVSVTAPLPHVDLPGVTGLQ